MVSRPRLLNKAVLDIMADASDNHNKLDPQVSEPKEHYHRHLPSAEDLAKQIKHLEKQMRKHAQNLEFEQATILRDKVTQLKSQLIFET